MSAINYCWANIRWGRGQPYSLDFNDIYFNTEDGLQETEYVFIAQNLLQQRFSASDDSNFTIIETGFGTGLNFFCTSLHWLNCAPASAKLHYVSLEKYPLMAVDMEKVTQLYPQFRSISNELLEQYSYLQVGLNTICVANGRIQLSLWIGDVLDTLPRIQNKADAWFLDGFAPAKNAEMWSEQVFRHISRLSKLGTTFATFTSAGEVRRGLQNIGFNVQKCAGYGKKREMLSGQFK
jgi:tRNA 5-methylaminomethyl-2-thiouridine biosynthesis bifunctional protein